MSLKCVSIEFTAAHVDQPEPSMSVSVTVGLGLNHLRRSIDNDVGYE
jgi:hypothetical protein